MKQRTPHGSGEHILIKYKRIREKKGKDLMSQNMVEIRKQGRINSITTCKEIQREKTDHEDSIKGKKIRDGLEEK